MKRPIIKTFLIAFILFFSVGKIYANVDIELKDNKETKEISVMINSNTSSLYGVNIPIIFSDNDTQIEEVINGNYCSLLFSGDVINNKIDIECFNDKETSMNGLLATIKYSTDSTNYFFYTDKENLDLGNAQVGELNDINKPDIKEEIETQTTTDKIEADNETTKSLGKDKSIPIILGIIFLGVCVAALIVFSAQKPTAQNTTPTNAKTEEQNEKIKQE